MDQLEIFIKENCSHLLDEYLFINEMDDKEQMNHWIKERVDHLELPKRFISIIE